MNKQDRLNATFRLWKDFSFEAAHQLTKLRVHCQGKLNPAQDWVVDYADIAAAVRPIVQKLDHSFLNDQFDFETTAENLVWWFANELTGKLPSICAVELYETPTTSVLFEIE
jgi:6-pyruvoyltetrahydropterin/6-carboxytetrahydropterin synthase